MKISKAKIKANDEVTVSIDVKNTGKVAGKESVLLYLSDEYASITPEVKALKGFEKINLAPNEMKTVTFKLDNKALQFVNNDLKWVAEKGTFKVQIGNQMKTFVLE